MDIDRISYIFGSLARRRQGSVGPTNSSKRRSSETPTKVQHERTQSAPHQAKRVVMSPSKSKPSVDDTKFRCTMCKEIYIEPRVLPCLHTFCLRCLEQLERDDLRMWNDDDSEAGRSGSTSSRKDNSSGGSGYASDKVPEPDVRGICCPKCGERAQIPQGGASFFPPNYILQHRMVLATLNSESIPLLCDMCPSEFTAVSRCMTCATNFCDQCEQMHLRQKSFTNHEVLSLEEARAKGITKIRLQVMCMRHPDTELSVFCNTCYEVICKECTSSNHQNHAYESVSRAAKSHVPNLKSVAGKAKCLMDQSAVATSRLTAATKSVEAQCNKVQADVEKFIEEYVRFVEEHKIGLLEQIAQAKENKLQTIINEKLKLQKNIRDARDTSYFLDELLKEGTDVEIMSFFGPILNKIENCDNFELLPDMKCSESLQFLPEESVKCPNSFFTLHGVITTQRVSAEHCQLNSEVDLSNLRVEKKVELLLETKDSNNTRLERGGEYVVAEIRHREAGVKSLPVNVYDRRDGTYSISFVPDVTGKLALIVKVKGEQIKGSPFPVTVRSLKPHRGIYHCCSFCSSGGRAAAAISCGCGGRMPGAAVGCGHGHPGHPGRRHWSCCGNILEHSECSAVGLTNVEGQSGGMLHRSPFRGSEQRRPSKIAQ